QKEALCLPCPEAPSTSLGSEASGMDHHTVETCIVIRRISISGLFLEEMDAVCSRPKKKRTIQTVTSNKSKGQGLSWYGVVSALGKGNVHFCDGTINAEKYIEILEQH